MHWGRFERSCVKQKVLQSFLQVGGWLVVGGLWSSAVEQNAWKKNIRENLEKIGGTCTLCDVTWIKIKLHPPNLTSHGILLGCALWDSAAFIARIAKSQIRCRRLCFTCWTEMASLPQFWTKEVPISAYGSRSFHGWDGPQNLGARMRVFRETMPTGYIHVFDMIPSSEMSTRFVTWVCFEDGFLYDTELRPFADRFGFEGSQSEWAWGREIQILQSSSHSAFCVRVNRTCGVTEAEESHSALIDCVSWVKCYTRMCQDAFVADSIPLRLFFFLAPHASGVPVLVQWIPLLAHAGRAEAVFT